MFKRLIFQQIIYKQEQITALLFLSFAYSAIKSENKVDHCLSRLFVMSYFSLSVENPNFTGTANYKVFFSSSFCVSKLYKVLLYKLTKST